MLYISKLYQQTKTYSGRLSLVQLKNVSILINNYFGDTPPYPIKIASILKKIK
jgi:hypothetical protein